MKKEETRKRNLTVGEAAERLGKSAIFVRLAMQKGILPIGTVIKMPGASKYNYYISPERLEAYIKGELK